MVPSPEADPAVTFGSRPPPQLGLMVNLGQFALLVGMNGLVGAMVGQERTLVPLIASQSFAIATVTAALSFLVAFGLAKAFTNLLAGALADRYGRRPVLFWGWVIALPVPLLLALSPTWTGVIAANVLLGVSQGLTWSMTVLMKIDLVGPRLRGLALGLNEAAGYVAVGLSALATGLVAEHLGLRPAPFLIGLAICGLGLLGAGVFTRETRGHAQLEAASGAGPHAQAAFRTAFLRTSFGDRALSTASFAGFVNNLNDGMAWGLLPIVYAAAGLSLGEVGLLAAAYPVVWGLGQLLTGPASDRAGRRGLIVAGFALQAVAIALIAATQDFGPWLLAALLLGLGTAMVYPTLLAVVADVAAPAWRGASLGTYRLWRDLGYVGGALGAGLLADALGASAAVLGVAAMTLLAGGLSALRLPETRPGA